MSFNVYNTNLQILELLKITFWEYELDLSGCGNG